MTLPGKLEESVLTFMGGWPPGCIGKRWYTNSISTKKKKRLPGLGEKKPREEITVSCLNGIKQVGKASGCWGTSLKYPGNCQVGGGQVNQGPGSKKGGNGNQSLKLEVAWLAGGGGGTWRDKEHSGIKRNNGRMRGYTGFGWWGGPTRSQRPPGRYEGKKSGGSRVTRKKTQNTKTGMVS